MSLRLIYGKSGTGIDRLAMFKYGITDMRYLYLNDVRFLSQFDRKD